MPSFHTKRLWFGLSDATEVCVFLSGFTWAIADGRCLERTSLWLGSARKSYDDAS
ncbi:OpgC domain-containing protein [Methylomonas koyamae]|uniref:OpgC domain-containing protein n=1 Tax=Methylomonas koyamae TaxID=702114 RepID=UPI0012F69CBC